MAVGRQSDVVTEARDACRDLLAARERLAALRFEITSQGGSTWLDEPGTFAGENDHLTKEDVVAAVFTVGAEYETWIGDSGRSTAIYKLR